MRVRSSYIVSTVLVSLLWASAYPAARQEFDSAVIVDEPAFLFPDPTRTPLATLPAGTLVRVMLHDGDWCQVLFRDPRIGDRIGYVRAAHVRTLQSSAPESAATTAPEAPPTSASAAPVVGAAADAADAVADAPSRATAQPGVPATSASRLPEAERRVDLDKGAIADAVRIGMQQKGRTQGLRLVDSAQQFVAGMGSLGDGAIASNGFRVQIYTPLAWIRQLASDAAKEYRQFSVTDLSDEATEPVLRVVAYPDTRNTVSRDGMLGTSSVRHLVLRDESKRIVVQPIFKEAFSVEAANAMGGKAAFEGLRLKFPMDAVRDLRGPNRDREFFVTVIGTTGEERDFRVKKKHFDDLPE
jgi:hypothetical protein